MASSGLGPLSGVLPGFAAWNWTGADLCVLTRLQAPFWALPGLTIYASSTLGIQLSPTSQLRLSGNRTPGVAWW